MKLPKKPRTFVIIAVIGLIAGLVVLRGLRKEPLDLSKEEAPFPAIHMPPQAVYGDGYMDGGSVGILIIDHSGARHELTFPIDYTGIRNAHPTAFFGNMNDPKRVPLKNPGRAKEIAIRLLDDFGKEFEDPSVESSDMTARTRRALASPPDVLVVRAFDKLRRTFGF
jgi:hypothetical protein